MDLTRIRCGWEVLCQALSSLRYSLNARWDKLSLPAALAYCFAPVGIIWSVAYMALGKPLNSAVSMASSCLILYMVTRKPPSAVSFTLCLIVNSSLFIESLSIGACYTLHKTVIGVVPALSIFLSSNLREGFFFLLFASVQISILNMESISGDDPKLGLLARFGMDVTLAVCLFLLTILYERNRRKAEHSRSMFMSVVSHELRTPMNGILCAAELIMSDEVSGRDAEDVSAALGSAYLLCTLINNALDSNLFHSRYNGSANFIRFSPEHVCSRLLLVMQHVARMKEVAFTFRSDIVGCVYGDPSKLSQVLTNVLCNALKVLWHIDSLFFQLGCYEPHGQFQICNRPILCRNPLQIPR